MWFRNFPGRIRSSIHPRSNFGVIQAPRPRYISASASISHYLKTEEKAMIVWVIFNKRYTNKMDKNAKIKEKYTLRQQNKLCRKIRQ